VWLRMVFSRVIPASGILQPSKRVYYPPRIPRRSAQARSYHGPLLGRWLWHGYLIHGWNCLLCDIDVYAADYGSTCGAGGSIGDGDDRDAYLVFGWSDKVYALEEIPFVSGRFLSYLAGCLEETCDP